MRLLPACLLLLAAMPAVATDLILHNGLVWTGDPARPPASALAIEDGRITAVGDDATILALAGPATQRIDLQGHTVGDRERVVWGQSVSERVEIGGGRIIKKKK